MKDSSTIKTYMERMDTERYEIVIGVVPGYHHNNEEEQVLTLKEVSEIFQEVTETIEPKVSGVANQVNVVYSTNFGCPVGGEVCYQISCTRNPKFCESSDSYYCAVMEVVIQLKELFKQSTVSVSKTKVEYHYIADTVVKTKVSNTMEIPYDEDILS
ncbi:MAG: hypothetical protein PHC62_00015 [Candidatus Izemoplasmatales bacterium]|nr:hypothetical protein [Candidatus Izemoplasmatales bacterium]